MPDNLLENEVDFWYHIIQEFGGSGLWGKEVQK